MRIKKIFLLLVVMVIGGCSRQTQSEETKKTIETANGTFTVALLQGWKELEPTALNEEADISLTNANESVYVVVISESAEDFKDFDTYKNKADLRKLIEVTNETETPIASDSWKGTRYTFDAVSDGLNISYIYDLVQSDAGHYVQRIGWTKKSNMQPAKKSLETTLDSIHDVSGF